MTSNEEERLDALLSMPLLAVADDGFSQSIATRIESDERRGTSLEIAGGVAALLLVMIFVPLGALAQTIIGAAIILGTSLPLAIACAALVLSQAAMRLLAD